ncbi:MAG TPA: serine/threonine-protein kinase [Ktedonobacteraceae bacterium]|nr:serine/threonine-protein kinase [Ktedonobacteraceae bacterium]
MAELEGKTLARYELRRLIGKGGMANVYEAFDQQTQRLVAVKIFKREDEEMLRRFVREAQLMASLRDNHLVPIYDYGAFELDNFTRYYLVMPYIDGGTLRSRIRRGPLSLIEACHVIRDMASALDYIHSQGIIHRDIKASNVLMSEDGSCFLTDFGIARITSDATQLTSTGNVLGTVDYVAPELFEVDRRADVRSDLYSLGVLLYEMVTGRLPFSAENQIALVSMHMHKRPPSPRSIVSTIPPQVERVLLKALEKKPEQRYASAKELAEAFCRAVSVSTKMSIPDAPGTALPAFAAPLIRPDQLVLSAPVGTQFIAPNSSPEGRPSPLADGTGGVQFPTSRSDGPIAQAQLPEVAPPASGMPPSSIPPRTRPFYRRVWFALALGLVALLIIGGSITALFLPRGHAGTASKAPTQTAATSAPTQIPTATPNLTATAQAAVAASATARAQATATAIAGLTATAAANASATAGVIQTATSGQPAYQDTLKNPNNPVTTNANWDQGDQCVFQTNGYHVTVGNGLKGCREAGNNYQNTAITVDMRILTGQSGGIFFRMNTSIISTFAGYLFEVDNTGKYRILSSGNYSFGSPTTLKDWTPARALRPGSASNTLQLIARGSDLFFYANGAFLTHLTDSSYTSGQIGFLARSDGTPSTDVVYTNLNVYPVV